MENFRDSLMHSIPFLSILSTSPPENRPALTRLIEQSLVGLAAAFIALQVMQARQSENINELRRLIEEQRAENRTTRAELREQIDKMRADLYAPRR